LTASSWKALIWRFGDRAATFQSRHSLRGWSCDPCRLTSPFVFQAAVRFVPNYSVVKEPFSATTRAAVQKSVPSLPLRVSPVGSRSAHAAKTAQFIRDIVTNRINIGDLRHGSNGSGARCRASKVDPLADGTPPRRFSSRLLQSSQS
jgi:hypothetical protein